MSTTDTRAAFEAQAVNDGYRIEVGPNGKDYLSGHTQVAWEWWQAATEAAKAEPAEFKGWYCAHCQRGVDASEVTFHEQHTECGRVITDDRPPAAKATGTAGDAITMSRDDLVSYRNAAFNEGIAEGLDRAARQPAPALPVKPWEERAKVDPNYKLSMQGTSAYYMAQEIADLRAAVATTNRSQP